MSAQYSCSVDYSLTVWMLEKKNTQMDEIKFTYWEKRRHAELQFAFKPKKFR